MSIKEAIASLPLTCEAWWTWQSLLNRRKPFDGRWEKVRTWLEVIERRSRPGLRQPPRRRVLLYAALPYWMETCTVIGLMLVEHGCDVEIAWHPREYIFDATERNMRFQRWSAAQGGVPSHPRLRFTNMDELPRGSIPAPLEATLGELAFMDTQYAARKERVGIAAGNEEELFRQRRDVLREVMERTYPFLSARQSEYDWLIIPNGKILEYAAIRAVAEHLRLGYTTLEIHERRGCIVLAQNRSCLPYDFDDQWLKDSPHELSPERRQRAERRLYARENPGMGEDYIWPGQHVAKSTSQEAFRQLGLDPAKPTALLATNIAWDSAVLGQSRAFATMADWIKASVGWFAQRPDWQLIVRTHPAEAWYPSNESTQVVIQEVLPSLPSHLRLILPEEKVNTYSLLAGIRFGLLFTSTLGLEMACRGLTVITAGKVHYDGKGFTLDPASPEEYWKLLEEQTSRKDAGGLEPRRQELALCYFDMFYERANSLPVVSVLNEREPAAIDAVLTACEAPASMATVGKLIGLDLA